LPLDRPARIAELGAGSGALASYLLAEKPDVSVVALDKSPAMLAELARLQAEYPQRISIREFDLAASEWRSTLSSHNCVISSLALHHLTHDEKRFLFRDVFRHISDAGRFMIADIIEPRTDIARRNYALQWDEAVQKLSAERFGDGRAFPEFVRLQWNHFFDPHPDPVDMPAPLLDRLDWLTDAGFHNVDVHWLYAGHTILSADK
jgi:tRNA (cmo5U34)-methyltransferase